MTSDPTDLAPGRTVDRFRIDAVLGRGAMATVYRATHLHLGTVHAIKVLDVAAQSVHRRLLIEGRAQASLRHANIVSVSDVVHLDHSLGLVMEFVDGPTLRLLLEKHRLTFPQAYDLGCGILDGVRAAHEAGIVHRDLKPANILLDVSGRRPVAKITDFGLAKVLHTQGDVSETRSGASMGTPAYMAPEQVRDAKDVDHRADVFALGCILYELVAGCRPFEGEDVFAVMAAITRGEFVPLPERRPDTPEAMVNAVAAALVTDRDLRIPDVEQLSIAWRAAAPAVAVAGTVWPTTLVEGLRSASPGARIGDLPTAVPPTPRPEAYTALDGPVATSVGTDRPPGRRIGPIWIGVTVAAATLAVGALALLPRTSTPGPAPSPVAQPRPETPEPTSAVTAPPPAEVAPAAPPAEVQTPPPEVKASPPSLAPRPRLPVPPPAARRAAAPAPAPAVAPPETEAQTATVPAPPPPRPAPPPDTARVRSRGGVDVWLRAPQGNFLADGRSVPPGRYAVDVFFGGASTPTRVMTIDLAAGDDRTIACDGAQLRCRLE